MIGKTTMQISPASVAEALEEYINRHLVSGHRVKVTGWHTYKNAATLESDTTVTVEEVPALAGVLLKQTDAPDDGACRGVGACVHTAVDSMYPPPSETKFRPGVVVACGCCGREPCVCAAAR